MNDAPWKLQLIDSRPFDWQRKTRLGVSAPSSFAYGKAAAASPSLLGFDDDDGLGRRRKRRKKRKGRRRAFVPPPPPPPPPMIEWDDAMNYEPPPPPPPAYMLPDIVDDEPMPEVESAMMGMRGVYEQDLGFFKKLKKIIKRNKNTIGRIGGMIPGPVGTIFSQLPLGKRPRQLPTEPPTAPPAASSMPSWLIPALIGGGVLLIATRK